MNIFLPIHFQINCLYAYIFSLAFEVSCWMETFLMIGVPSQFGSYYASRNGYNCVTSWSLDFECAFYRKKTQSHIRWI